MRRKLVKQGASTLTVSLPAKWVHANQLRPGQDVTVDVRDNIVRVLADVPQSGPKTACTDIRGLSEKFISDLLQMYYRKGYLELDLRVDEQQVKTVQTLLQHSLLGYEIIDRQEDQLIVRFVTKMDVKELDALVRRLFLVTLNLAEAASRDEELLDYHILEETTDRISNYCESILIKHHASRPDAIFIYQLVSALERIADEYRRILDSAGDARDGARVCADLLRQAYDLHYDYSRSVHDQLLATFTQTRHRLFREGSSFVSILYVGQQLLEAILAANN